MMKFTSLGAQSTGESQLRSMLRPELILFLLSTIPSAAE